MWNKMLSGLPKIILTLALALLLSSVLNLAAGGVNQLPLKMVQSYMAISLLALSSVLVILNLLLSRHPFYEVWVTAMIGGVIGAVYLS